MLQLKPFKSDEKCFVVHLKSSFLFLRYLNFECTKLWAFVPNVPRVSTCSRALRPCVPSCLYFVRVFIFYEPYVPLFFYVHYVPSIFYVSYFPSFFDVSTCLQFFTGLTCLHFFTCLHFLRAYILFMYMLIKLTQFNELTYDCSCLLLVNSVIYQLLSSIFTSIKFMSYSA